MITAIGVLGWFMLVVYRGEEVNTIWFVVTAVATYAIAYRFYALYIQKTIMRPDDTNATPAERINNGKDFDPTNRVVLYGHHFAAIAGAGRLVGPVLAAQMGYLPGTLWIILGGVCSRGGSRHTGAVLPSRSANSGVHAMISLDPTYNPAVAS